MSKFIGILKCRLVDRGIYVNPGEIFEPDETYERSSRSLAAALRANWMRRISDHEISQIKSKQQAVVEEVKVQPTAQKKVSIEVVTPNAALSEMTDAAIADEVIDQNVIIAARDRKHDQQQLKEDTVDSIKDEIRQKTKKALKISRKVKERSNK
jgi:hypothetical protein